MRLILKRWQSFFSKIDNFFGGVGGQKAIRGLEERGKLRKEERDISSCHWSCQEVSLALTLIDKKLFLNIFRSQFGVNDCLKHLG